MRCVGIVAVATLALASCASSSGVYLTAPGIYRITTTAITSFGGEATAKAAAIKTANETCGKQGKTAMVLSDTADAQFTQASTSVTFKCVDR
jgi:hypothetical protein